MSEFLKLAFELVSQIFYNIVEWILSFFTGFARVFITGIPTYQDIFKSYFKLMGPIAKVFAILFAMLLIVIPIALIVLIIRKIIARARLRATADDNVTLYKEIGRLNKQVLSLMDEKNMILAMKTGVNAVNPGYLDENGDIIHSKNNIITMDGGEAMAPTDAFDPLSDGPVPMGAGGGSGFGSNSGGGIDETAIASAATVAAVAVSQAKTKADMVDDKTVIRFPKLHLVDLKYETFEDPIYDNQVNLEQFVESYRLFAASQMHLYYTPEIIRRFVSGMASSHLLILEGISGTGKTSLPYSFSRFMDYPATMVSVQPSYRDRTELLGYFNEFSKKFNETEFLRATYEASYRKDPCFIVLDEMNLARIEYYFAEMLSVLEMPNKDEWVIDLVPTAWQGDPVKLNQGKLVIPQNLWFIGTANNDDSTFTITDKVYDRGMPIELNQRADAFECELQPRCYMSFAHLNELFEKAREEHPVQDETIGRLNQLDQYLQTRFRLSFGNRIIKQMYDFVPVYVACGGTELDGMDYIIARKVLKKFESQNVAYTKDDIKGLINYIEKVFGEDQMNDSRQYLTSIENLY